MAVTLDSTAGTKVRPEQVVAPVLAAISLSHFLNDVLQSLLPAIYPILKESFSLDFSHIGLISFAFYLAGSALQPLVGSYTDRRPLPYSLVAGMALSLSGLTLLAFAPSYPVVLAAAILIGLGSSVFHPESSRVARMASGGRPGLAQSVFQLGGYTGSAVGPLLAAAIVVPRGQQSIVWFTLFPLVGMMILWRIGGWYRSHGLARLKPRSTASVAQHPRGKIIVAIGILIVLLFSKYIYLASLSSYYTFYLIEHFGVSVQTSQLLLFVYLGAVAAGTLIGGPLGDRIGRKYVIWGSILGVLPFTLALPHVGLVGTAILSVFIGLIISSAFAAIVVFAQELVPGRVGMISGLFFGLAFGVAGLGAALLGILADHAGIEFVFRVCAYLPAIGILAVFLPDTRKHLGA